MATLQRAKGVAFSASLILCSVSAAGQSASTFQRYPYLATEAALAAAATATFPSGVWRDDVASGVGAKALFYQPSGSACSLNSGAGDGGSQVPSSDGKCWLAQFQNAIAEVKEWGAYCDGSHTDTTALQAALNWVPSNGGTLVFPSGNPCYVGALAGNGNPVELQFHNTWINTTQYAAPVFTFTQTATGSFVKTSGSVKITSTASAAAPSCFVVSFPASPSFDYPTLELGPIYCLSAATTVTSPYPGSFTNCLTVTNSWYGIIRDPWCVGPFIGALANFVAGTSAIILNASGTNGIAAGTYIENPIQIYTENFIWITGYAEGTVIVNPQGLLSRYGVRVGARTFNGSGTPSGSSGITQIGGYNGQRIQLYGGTIVSTVDPMQIDTYQDIDIYGTWLYNQTADTDGLPYFGALLYSTNIGNFAPTIVGASGNQSGSIGIDLGDNSSTTSNLNIGGTMWELATGISAGSDTADNNADFVTNGSSIATPISDSGTGNGFMVNKGQNWTSYTPTLSCGSGTISSATPTGYYKPFGKTIQISISVSIAASGIGSCAGYLKLSLPLMPGQNGNLAGADAVSGKGIHGQVLGGTSTINVLGDDASFPFANSDTVTLAGVYQVP